MSASIADRPASRTPEQTKRGRTVLCRNLVVNVDEMHELGTDPDGFGSPPKVEPRIIRFPGLA